MRVFRFLILLVLGASWLLLRCTPAKPLRCTPAEPLRCTPAEPLRCTPAEPLRSSPPVLVFPIDHVDLGPLEAGHEVVALADWRCDGAGTLRVLALRPDCRCAEASGLPVTLQGGDRGRLRIRLQVPTRGGPLRARVRIVTNGPPGRDVLTLHVSGVVTGDWQFEPGALDLGRWGPGGLATRMAAFEGPPEVVAGLARRLLEPRIEGFLGRVQILPPARATPGAYARLRLEIRIPEAAGLHRGYLLVHVPGGEARLLPIRCTTVANGQPPLFPYGKGRPPESEQTQNAHDVQSPDTARTEPGVESPPVVPGQERGR